ncbi:chymotrypsinogen B-like [Ostrinia furnacalis]|uniref:chymotrypsinogen B-like n=1 Tax=Ostrinia furnacalis TaxID=93504 RepID=UPI001039BA9D|nr:chymotrypsinogen B-like [Ostrinia furnacalis]
MNVLLLLIFLIHTTKCNMENRVITSLKYSIYRVKPVVVNGEPATNDRVPYLVSIKQPSGRIGTDIFWTNMCGGSIVGEQKVLTAAHCFEGNSFYYVYNAHQLRVVAGSQNSNLQHSGATDTTPDLQVRKITKAILNRGFHFPTHDIAIVFVDVPWNFTDTVNFIIPAKKTTDYPYTCISAGYGRIGHDTWSLESDVLLIASIRVLSRWRCSTLWQMNMNTFVCSDSAITDVARGDSGGPLACYDTMDPEEVPGKDLLVGIVSGKNFDKTTLFTRVSEYRDWIDSNFAYRLSSTFSILFTIISMGLSLNINMPSIS